MNESRVLYRNINNTKIKMADIFTKLDLFFAYLPVYASSVLKSSEKNNDSWFLVITM